MLHPGEGLLLDRPDDLAVVNQRRSPVLRRTLCPVCLRADFEHLTGLFAFRAGVVPLRALVLREAKISGVPPRPRIESGKPLEIGTG